MPTASNGRCLECPRTTVRATEVAPEPNLSNAQSKRENNGMNVKQRHEPIFLDGIYALVLLAVIAWPLWILAGYLMDKLGWFNVHPFAGQIIGFSILGWVALFIISAVIASIRKRKEQMAADLGFVVFVIVITAIAVTLTLSQIYLQNPR